MVSENGQVHLTDFGLASFVDEESTLTETGVVLGTPSYMSPEQAIGSHDMDGRTDVYSLGATLYECLSRARPFRGSTADVIRQVLRSDPIPLRRIDPSIPRDLDIICSKALSKEPSQRYQSAADFAEDLSRWLNRKAIRAKPHSSLRKGKVWVQRNPWIAGLTAALVLSVIVGFVAVVRSWRQATVQRDMARENLRKTIKAVDQFLPEDQSPFRSAGQAWPPTIAARACSGGRPVLSRISSKLAGRSRAERRACQCLGSLAEIVETIGTSEEMTLAWEEAAKAYWAVYRERKGEEDWKRRYYGSRFHQANGLTQSNRLDEAMTCYEEVRSIVKEFQKFYPNDIGFQRDLASCSGSLETVCYGKNFPIKRLFAIAKPLSLFAPYINWIQATQT